METLDEVFEYSKTTEKCEQVVPTQNRTVFYSSENFNITKSRDKVSDEKFLRCKPKKVKLQKHLKQLCL